MLFQLLKNKRCVKFEDLQDIHVHLEFMFFKLSRYGGEFVRLICGANASYCLSVDWSVGTCSVDVDGKVFSSEQWESNHN